MKKALSLVASLAITVGLVGCGQDLAQNQSEEPLKIGIIYPMTGDAAAIGDSFKNGIDMALEDITPATKAKMEIIYEDDGLQPKNTVTALNKLINIDDIDLIINISSVTGNAIAPLIEQKQIPFIAAGASDGNITKDRKYPVRLWVTPEEETKSAVAEAQKRGYKRIAEIVTANEFTILATDLFNKSTEGEIEVIMNEEYTPENKDFKSYIAKLRGKEDVDAIMANLMPGQLGLFAKQVREAGIDLPIFGYEVFEDSNEVKLSNGALVGSWYVNGDNPKGSFLEDYQAMYPESSTFGGPAGYDTITLISTAIEEVGTDPEKVNTFLHTVKDFKGVMGTYSADGNGGYTIPAAVKIVTEDGFEKLYK